MKAGKTRNTESVVRRIQCILLLVLIINPVPSQCQSCAVVGRLTHEFMQRQDSGSAVPRSDEDDGDEEAGAAGHGQSGDSELDEYSDGDDMVGPSWQLALSDVCVIQ